MVLNYENKMFERLAHNKSKKYQQFYENSNIIYIFIILLLLNTFLVLILYPDNYIKAADFL